MFAIAFSEASSLYRMPEKERTRKGPSPLLRIAILSTNPIRRISINSVRAVRTWKDICDPFGPNQLGISLAPPTIQKKIRYLGFTI